MRKRFVVAAMVCLMLPGARAAVAQDAPAVGITMGYPGIGVIWRASERVAVRPEISLSFASTATDTSLVLPVSVDRETNDWSIGTGVSVLFYLPKSDNLRTYLAPGFHYNRSSFDTGLTE